MDAVNSNIEYSKKERQDEDLPEGDGSDRVEDENFNPYHIHPRSFARFRNLLAKSRALF